MKNRTKNRIKNTTKNKQRRRQKIKSRKNKMKRNAKRTLRRGGSTENSLINSLINSTYLNQRAKNNNVWSNSSVNNLSQLSPQPTTPLQPPPQPTSPPQHRGQHRGQRLPLRRQSDPPIPYQPPPQVPPQEQKRLSLVEQRQLILTKTLNKINYSSNLIKYYLNKINDELIILDYHSDAKYIKESLESDLSDMIIYIDTEIIPNRTNYGIYIFNNVYIGKYNYAIRNIMHTIELINKKKKSSYFVIFERTKDKNKKLEEIVKMFKIIKKEYAKIYNNVKSVVSVV